MKHLLLTVAVTAATIAETTAQACAAGSAHSFRGNWYCQAVNAISYTNFGTPGQYNKVTSFNEDGKCSSSPTDYAGGISPMDEEVSWHFRGPLSLKQFAFYTPGTTTQIKRDMKPSPHERRHIHKHIHPKEVHVREAAEQVEERAPCAMVTATIDSAVVSWMNDYNCGSAGAVVAAATSAVHAAPSALPSMNAGAGYWGQQAYYDAVNQNASGVVFLNHMGGQGSGVFDYTHGNSLSYASFDATTGSATPQILADIMLDDDNEVIIMSDTPCTNGDCGTVRPGGVAYHGFEGSQKLFLLEFSMPLTGKTGFVQDMPAIWTLNAQIPNTLQYGEATCSCWQSGCGEWDIFEILDSGNTRAKSTFHGNPSGGDSNYFNRPTDKTIKAAVIFDGDANSGHIVILPDTTVFDQSITDEVVAAWVNQMHSEAQKAAFRLGG